MPCAVKGDCEGVQGRTPSMVVLFGGAGRNLCRIEYLAPQKFRKTRRKPLEALTAYTQYAEVVRAAATTYYAVCWLFVG